MAENATNGETKPENNKKEDLTNGDEAATPTVKEQRAIVLTGFGGIKSVKVLKKPEPQPAEGEVLIRVKTGWVSAALYCMCAAFLVFAFSLPDVCS